MTIADFQKQFPNETACRKHLFTSRWPDGYRCPNCRHPHYYYVRTRDLYECCECRTQTSVTAGTLLHGTKLPLQYWFLAIFLISNGQPCSARWLSITLELNYRTALGMLRKIRHVMRKENGPHPLSNILKSGDLPLDSSEETVDVSDARSFDSYPNSEPGFRTHYHSNTDFDLDSDLDSDSKSPSAHVYEHVIVQRAKNVMLRRALTYIRLTYQRVRESNLQSYIDEFYFYRAGHLGLGRQRLFSMLNSFVTKIPMF